ncbi:hypothetical protein ACHAXT_000374 [Thalassiosira profunda]
MFNIAALAARPSSANATRPASANSRGRSRAPLSSVNSNLAGAPRTPRDVVPQKGAIGGGRAASTKRKRSRRRQKNEIYTPLVPHSAARGQRSTNGAARATHTLSLQPSKPSIEAPASAETPEAAVADRAAADATAAGKKEATASPYASIPAAHLGSAELALVLNFGHRSNVVGKVRSLPFRLEPPPPSADADARIPVAFERIPFAAGFDVVVGGHDAVKQEFVACNGKSLVDRNAPTVIHLRREEEEEAKVFHVLWAPKREGEVRDEIHITSPWGRHRIAVLGIARGSATFARPAKSVGRSNGADRFYGRDNITYDAQSWEEAQCATFRTWLNDLFHPNGEDKPVSEGQLAAEWKAARTLFESPRMRAVRCTVEREVREGRLSMTAKSGRHILDEVLVQDQLTKLLLSYSPRWLQLGLGIVLSMDDDASFQKLMMAKPMTKESLKKIIMQRVLTDPSAVRKYDRGRCNESKLQAIVHQRALSQSMILAFFLDKAKLQRVLVDDPCLFEPSSSLKSSDDVLVSLCQDCFSKQGSIIRHLAYDGVSVSHVQKPLDEYDFYVRNLAVDLKDGVCLAKLIDIVTGSSNLLSAMRLPAATRQFRAHNVNLALAALRQLGVPRISDITTAHIIDAHQPRVIQLLWSSVLHFDLPEFRQEIVQYNAARSIQSHSRRFLALKSYRVARQGTVMFQSLYRGFLIRAFFLGFSCEVIIHVEPSKFARHTAKAVRTLQKSKKFSEVMKAAMNLQMITQDSIEDCKVIAEGNIQRKMFAIIRSCNRSSPHLELIRVLLSVMTNLAEHPSTLPLVANETAINALTDMVQLYRDKSAIFALSSSLLERMLWSSNRLMSDYSTPENKKRLRGILLLCKTKASELDDARKGMRSLENVLRHL